MPSTTSVDEENTPRWSQQSMINGGRRSHGSAKIDQYRMIIVGGYDKHGNILSSGYIYDVRTQQSTPLRHDMPAALTHCCAVSNNGYVYVIGGFGTGGAVNTVYRLCLETEVWSIMAPMDSARFDFAAALKDNYIYVFGGFSNNASTERYSIDNNTREGLPDTPKGHRAGHCAVPTAGSEIYIVGGYDTRSVDVFDTATLTWKNETHLHDMPEERSHAAAVVLKNKYLVVIGGVIGGRAAGCLIFDFSSNRWSSTPASMDMIQARTSHSAAVLDGKIVVAVGMDHEGNVLESVECIDADALLEYAPLHYPLPDWILDQVLDIGKLERELVPCAVFDKLKAKKRKIN